MNITIVVHQWLLVWWIVGVLVNAPVLVISSTLRQDFREEPAAGLLVAFLTGPLLGLVELARMRRAQKRKRARQ